MAHLPTSLSLPSPPGISIPKRQSVNSRYSIVLQKDLENSEPLSSHFIYVVGNTLRYRFKQSKDISAKADLSAGFTNSTMGSCTLFK